MDDDTNTESLEGFLDEISLKVRAAQTELLSGGIYAYSCAPSVAPNQRQRLSEAAGNTDQKVYRVDVKHIQIYLDKVGALVDQFKRTVPPYLEMAPPEADLRFLELMADLEFPCEDEVIYKITAKCPINFAYSKIKCSVELVVLQHAYSLDVTHTRFECPFEIQISSNLHLDIFGEQVGFSEAITVKGHNDKQIPSSSSLSINAQIATFSKSLLFQDLRVVNAIFLRTTFNKKAEFFRTQFDGVANFRGTEFIEGVLFENCIFLKAPDFHESKLPQDTSFLNCYFDTSTSSMIDMAAFRVLKAHFGKMRDAKHELVFYALEHRAERRNSESDIAVLMLSWLYDEVSEYGASIERAIFIFVWWNVDFFLFFFNATATLNNNQLITVKNEVLSSYPALILMLQNIFNPLALFSEKQLVVVNSVWFYVASLIQSVGSIGILALMFLAIRSRFRKGSSSDS